MNNKIIKTIDEHNIDRDANIMFGFDLEGSEYVSYRITRDEEQDNLFVSKVIKNIDNTFNMLNIEDSMEKSKLNSIVMALVESAVKSPLDKLNGNSVTLSDGKIIKFIGVNFNKEQRIEVRKTYVTTVKKEVSRVAEKYYEIPVVVIEQPKVIEDIFPNVTPVTSSVVEEVKVVEPISVVPTPVVEPHVIPSVSPVNLQSVEAKEVVPAPIVNSDSVVSNVGSDVISANINSVVSNIEKEPVVSASTPVSSDIVSSTEEKVDSKPLVFNASKETNLNAALGEVASTSTIPVENISSLREFGVDEIVQEKVVNQPDVVSAVKLEEVSENTSSTGKAGFANSKFFMVVAIAFFLASCIFLGYEVFNYFQLAK